MERLSDKIVREKYLHPGETCWDDVARRVTHNVMPAYSDSDMTDSCYEAIRDRKFIPAGRFLYSAGREFHQYANCISLSCEDSREGWADLMHKSAMALQTGAGLGIRYNNVRPKGSPIRKTGGVASGVMSLVNIVDSIGREVIQGGSRRSAIMAMLNFAHGDIDTFINAKSQLGVLPCTNISVEIDNLNCLNTELFGSIVSAMYKNGEPGLVINIDTDEVLRNVCGEMTAKTDSTLCFLGSINLGAVNTVEEFERLLHTASAFLVAGTVLSDTPFSKAQETLNKDRRIGIGLMGIAEFLAKRKIPYGFSGELESYLRVYSDSTEIANKYTRLLGISEITKSRAIAPNGTISLVAETTGGIEPIFCEEYIREYYNSKNVLVSEHVTDPVADRIKASYGLSGIETAYTIPIRRRLALQAQVQNHVDMAVSSTVNFNRDDLSESDLRNALIEYIPVLRGLTVYPLGSRPDEPVKPVVSESNCKQGFCNT